MRYREFGCGRIFILVANRVRDEQEISGLGARSDVAAATVTADAGTTGHRAGVTRTWGPVFAALRLLHYISVDATLQLLQAE
jgi:hypothetical protein